MASHPLHLQDETPSPDNAKLQHARLARKVATLLADTSGLGARLAHAAPANGNTGLEQIDLELSSYFAHSYELGQRLQQETFSVAVLALAKSGKSTLLNALAGAPILPVNNIPETARVCRITHTLLATGEQAVLLDRSKGPAAESIVGEDAIRAHLSNLNREVRTRQHQLHDEVLLDVQLPIASLGGRGDAADDIAFQLLDTPGPNESGEEGLRYQVERMLDSVDAVCYLLDYTKLRTAEEATIFSRIKSINPGLVKRLSRRLFFVVNKVDTIRMSEGLDEDSTRQYVAELVTQQLSGDGFQLHPEQVLLVSAQEALLSRLMLRQEPQPAATVVQRFKDRAFGSSRAVQRKKFTAAELQAAAQDMLEDSGIQELENSVFGFLYSHAGVLKLMAIVDDLARMLSQMANSMAVSEGALMKDMAELQGEAVAMQQTLEDTLARFDEVQAQTATVEEEVVDEVRMRLGFLRDRLVDHVVAVLDSAAVGSEQSAPTGHWRAVFDKARAFLGRREAGADRAELQRTLQELHADVFKQIDQEVRGFWHQLETATNERQRALLHRLNAHLEGLSRAIEAVVEERLSVRLEPVDLRLNPPSAQEFHDSLQRLFTQGITQRSIVKERSREVECTQWEKRFRNGICRTGEYYVGRPSKRTVQEQYTEVEYEIQPEKIKEYFCELIGSTIEASVRSVRAFVKTYLAATIDEARAKITTYAERFTSSMLNALATSEQGEKVRLAALEHVRSHKEGLTKLLAESAALQAEAEALFPEAIARPSRASSLEFDDEDFLPASEEATFEQQMTEEAPTSGNQPAAAAPAASTECAASPEDVVAATGSSVIAVEAAPEATAMPEEATMAAHDNHTSPHSAAAVMHSDSIESLLSGSDGHRTDACSTAGLGPVTAFSDHTAASAGDGVGADRLAVREGGSMDDCSVISTVGNSTTAAAAASSPRSSRSPRGTEEEEDHLYDAASSLGGSRYYQAAPPDANDDVQHSADDRLPLENGAPAPSEVACKGFVANVRGTTVTYDAPAEMRASAPAPVADDAFSGAALGGSYASASASSCSHVRMVAAPVPAQDGAAAESAVGGVEGPDELATIPLDGGTTASSPSAASAASADSGEDWTMVEEDDQRAAAA